MNLLKPLVFILLIALLDSKIALAQGHNSKKMMVLYMDDSLIVNLAVSQNGCVLSFPVKPTKVILGRQKSFDIDYVSNDVALAPLSPDAKSNLYVYLLGRRYAFSLTTSLQGNGAELVEVRDFSEKPQLQRKKQ